MEIPFLLISQTTSNIEANSCAFLKDYCSQLCLLFKDPFYVFVLQLVKNSYTSHNLNIFDLLLGALCFMGFAICRNDAASGGMNMFWHSLANLRKIPICKACCNVVLV